MQVQNNSCKASRNDKNVRDAELEEVEKTSREACLCAGAYLLFNAVQTENNKKSISKRRFKNRRFHHD